MKKIICILLVLLMTVSVLPLSLAAENSITDGALTWSYNEITKTLTVSGEGEMPDYEWIEPKDWKEDNMRLPKEWTRAEHVVVEEGVTSIGDWAFMWFGAMADISLPDTLTKIGTGAFENTYLDYIEFPASLRELEGCFWTTAPPKVMIFKGDAPNLDNWSDFSLTVTFEQGDLTTIYYPKENATWTEEVKSAFGPRISWSDQTPAKPTAGEIFEDVKVDAWYYESLQYVYERGFMIGTAAHTFSPGAGLTRAQAVQMLFNMWGDDPEDYKGETVYYDVSADAWCAPAVNWATKRHVTSGTAVGEFEPNRLITRQELACLLQRFNNILDGGPGETADLIGYEDVDQIAYWARDSMAWCVNAGIITGMTETTLEPRANTTRAQTARMLMQFNRYILDNIPVIGGDYKVFADFIKENGEIDYESEDMIDYSYTVTKGDRRLQVYYAESFDIHSRVLIYYTPSASDEIDLKNYVKISMFHGLEPAYTCTYYYETSDYAVLAEGYITPEGYEERDGRLIYSEWDGSSYIPSSKTEHNGYETRDAAIEGALEMIELLLSECGLEYNDIFING